VFFVVVLLAQWAGARPLECGSLDSGRATNVWERAKAPELRKYCDLLASGASKLVGAASMAEGVLAIADEADHVMPGRAGPLVLRGRALAKLGRHAEALSALRAAKLRDERALDDPQSLLAFARALARTGAPDEAQEAYRSLLPRATPLAPSDRASAAVEAGLLALGRGSAGVDEAIAMLRQARRDAQDLFQPLSVMALALALDRSGERDEARAVLGERVHGDPRGLLGEARVKDVLATVGAAAEGQAMLALALEAEGNAGARDAWRAYVEAAPKSPWLEHAKEHEGGGARRARGGAP
jgi:tetratricopeptide (TPR) repeat protein